MSPCSARPASSTRRRPTRSRAGSTKIAAEIEAGKFKFSRALEDIHLNIESRLRELIGPVAGKLHTARSRNDQVATDFRLYVRDEIGAIDGALGALQLALAEKALEHAGDGDAGLHPSPDRAAGHLRPSSASPMSRCSGATAAASPTPPSG